MNGIYTDGLQAENAVLASILTDNTTWEEVGDYLQPNDFVLQFNQDIFRVLRHLITEGKKADIICVSQNLSQENSENDCFIELCNIMQGNYVPQNVKYYAEIVKQKSIDRKMVAVAKKIITDVNEQKENRLDYAQQAFTEISEEINSETTLVADILSNVMQKIDERQTTESQIIGTSDQQ